MMISDFLSFIGTLKSIRNSEIQKAVTTLYLKPFLVSFSICKKRLSTNKQGKDPLSAHSYIAPIVFLLLGLLLLAMFCDDLLEL